MNNNVFRSKISTAAVNTGSTAIILTPDIALSPLNEDRVAFYVTVSLPVAGMSLPVFISINGANVPVYDKYGNIVYGANIKTRFVMKGYFGTNGSGGTNHIQLVNLPLGRACSCN